MADPEHMEILKQGVEAWNIWRNENPDIVPNLNEANLVGAYITGVNLSGASLVGADLERANFLEANFVGAYLLRANLREALLEGADLRGANLSGANLEGAILAGANLEGAYLLRANFEGANLLGASLEIANLEGVYLRGANLEHAIIKSTLFSSEESLKNLVFPLTKEQLAGCLFTEESKKQKSSGAESLESLEHILRSEMGILRDNMQGQLKKYEEERLDPKLIKDTVSEELQKTLKGNLTAVIGEESLKQAEEYSEREAEQNKKKRLRHDIEDQFNVMLEKIGGYALRAEKSTKNFFIGALAFAFSGLAVALWNFLIFYADFIPVLKESTTEPSFFVTIFHVPVSVPLIILLELFAFIMFRYYSKALERMRAYTDEVNTLQMIKTGFLSIVEYGKEEDITTAGRTLMTMERNRVIEGKGTRETLNGQDETQNLTKMLNMLTRLEPSFSKDGK